MARPIYVTNSFMDNIVEEFKKFLEGTRMMDGEISFRKSYAYSAENTQRVHVDFTPAAYTKMIGTLNHFSTEVAWHGSVTRVDPKHYVINDIIIYPQIVTGATVETDQEEYDKWSIALDDDFFNSMRMQGHSHVNFSTTPSNVDIEHQRKILSQLKGDDFYIFVIFNKRLEHTVRVYDFASNTMYDDKDIVVGIAEDSLDMESFLKGADDMVKSKALSRTKGSENIPVRQYSIPKKNDLAKKDAASTTPKKAAKKAPKNPQYSFLSDDDDHPYGDVDYDALMFGKKEAW